MADPADDPDPAGEPDPAESPDLPVSPIPADTGYTSDGVPTFESVREKIETRVGAAAGMAELDADTAEGRSAAEQLEARDRAAAERLAQIRASMRESGGS